MARVRNLPYLALVVPAMEPPTPVLWAGDEIFRALDDAGRLHLDGGRQSRAGRVVFGKVRVEFVWPAHLARCTGEFASAARCGQHGACHYAPVSTAIAPQCSSLL